METEETKGVHSCSSTLGLALYLLQKCQLHISFNQSKESESLGLGERHAELCFTVQTVCTGALCVCLLYSDFVRVYMTVMKLTDLRKPIVTWLLKCSSLPNAYKVTALVTGSASSSASDLSKLT